MGTVLVTGGSGFIAAHCILQLLTAGYPVRTTLRNLQRVADVRAMLATGGAGADAAVSFVAADLERDDGWDDAARGCEFVLHVASPFPAAAPQRAEDLVVPARDGALRVLRAARAAGVRRVVLTSSFAAVGYGHPARTTPFDERDWTDLNARLSAYVRSKTVAEQAAWEFMRREGGALELAVVNPTAVFGPVLGPDYSTSILLLQRMLAGAMPANPQLYFGVVDVRDVADLHRRAMIDPAARGERFLALAGDSMSLAGIARVLKDRLGPAARQVSTRQAPNWLVRLVALRDRSAREILPELGKLKPTSNEKARRLLGWTPRSNEEAIVSAAESLLRLGLVKGSPAVPA
jgi:nucleoside-diphosphate-sugar epimerase